MTTFRKSSAIVLLAATLAACNGTTYISDRNGHSLTVSDGLVTLHTSGKPDAVVDAKGGLSIDGKPITVTPAQRALLKTYRDEAASIRSAGIATGKAAVGLAAHAIGDAVTGAGSGNDDHAQSRIDEQAKGVEAKALAICDHLDALQATQDKLAASLPAFKPYAGLEVRADIDCRRNAQHHD